MTATINTTRDALLSQSVQTQNRKIFEIYSLYRLVLAAILLLTFKLAPGVSIIGYNDPGMFQQVASLYLLINLVMLMTRFIPFTVQHESRLYLSTCLADTLILSVISHTSGAVASGMANMLIVPIAAGSILLETRLSIFLAAVGSLAVIYSEIYLLLTIHQGNSYYVQAGVLGMTLFTTAIVVQFLGRRIRLNELINIRQAANIESLRVLNQTIIQRMRTGVIVISPIDEILHVNNAARSLMMIGDNVDFTLPMELENQLNIWRNSPNIRQPPFRLLPGSPQLQASFTYLNPDTRQDIVIFIEDYSAINSRVQQMKLVSLGRLTASIAHEVRNPLAAISHAGQLLAESGSLLDSDRRLTEIINTQSNRVNTIIENILQLSRGREGTREAIHLRSWLEHFVPRLSSCYEEGVNINLQVIPEDIQILFNRNQLEQVLLNLCDNGIRYSMKKTAQPLLEIHVHIEAFNHTPVLDVIDAGDGVPASIEEMIFEPFFTSEPRGNGLGLYICREICEANHAQISHRRTAEGKSCFRINFSSTAPEME
jgi:two-component system, NtrC family, sensor histidine kinase PilS